MSKPGSSKIAHLLSALESLPDLVGNFLTCLVSISETHVCILVVKHGIRDVSVSGLHGSLEEHRLFALPHLQDRHAVDWAALDILGRLIGDIVGSHNQAHVNILHLVVHLVHLENPVVRHRSLGQQHIHLPRHSPSHRVDSKPHVDTVLSAGSGDGCHLSLSTSHGHAIPRDDHHFLGIGQKLRHLLRLDLTVHLRSRVGILLHRRNSVHPAEDHVEDVSVHSLAHDESQDGSAESDQRSNDGQHSVVQHEALGDQRPTTVGVEHGDADRHVSSANGGYQVDAHPAGQHGRGPLHLGRDLGAVSGHEHINEPEECEQTHKIDQVLARQVPGRGGHSAIQLQKGND
mmetsp:Transcript_32767/g.78869  ORF Transcript_32767/g.78869 Transcript_32767/m.78869 type:complete len:345 (+) Transcript_32767:85-1119(+)